MMNSSIRQMGAIFLLGFVTALVMVHIFSSSSSSGGDDGIATTTTTTKLFKGKQYWKEGQTQKVTTLYETPFARFQLHQVQLEDGRTTVEDWMWYDEGDNINVLVETLEGKYLVFQQTKYGFDGLSYAVVGGLIEPNETPLQAAQRELKEELNLKSTQWIPLGSARREDGFRAAANRGGGMTFPFLARKCTSIDGTTSKATAQTAEGELENQKVLELSRQELLNALLEGKFQEIKWTATVALALLHDEEREHKEN